MGAGLIVLGAPALGVRDANDSPNPGRRDPPYPQSQRAAEIWSPMWEPAPLPHNAGKHSECAVIACWWWRSALSLRSPPHQMAGSHWPRSR